MTGALELEIRNDATEIEVEIDFMGERVLTGALGDAVQAAIDAYLAAHPPTAGKNGVTFTPRVSSDGTLSWENNGGLANPTPISLKGMQGESGKSAYAYAKEGGYSGSEAAFAKQLAEGYALPDYVEAEADAVAASVQETRTGKSLTLVTLADVHLNAETSVETRSSLRMAGQGISALRKRMGVDAAVVLGDLSASDGRYTADMVKADWRAVKEAWSDALHGLVTAWVPGNHEINYGALRDRTMTENEIYAFVGANGTGLLRDPDFPEKNYGFTDFPDQRIRVIFLNTADALSEYPSTDGAKANSEFVGSEQLAWLAGVALDFSEKRDAERWGIVFCSHHPLSYGGDAKIGRAMRIVEAYRDGTAGSITYTSDRVHTVEYDFTKGARAEIICNFCGHSHNFGYGYMRYSAETDPWLLRICTPCINVGRENEHATNADLASLGEFDANGAPVYWRKTVGTREGTSFTVNTIDREHRMIYSYAFGAGPDRAIPYAGAAEVRYSVTNVLSGCTSSNPAETVREGSSYTASLTENDGYTLTDVTVTMGGADVTASVYANGVITVPSVTGVLVITATATETVTPPSYTNRIPLSTDTDGSVYHGTGYATATRLNSSGAAVSGGLTTTGFIPCKVGDVIRLHNVNLCKTAANYAGGSFRICFYDSSKAYRIMAQSNSEALDPVKTLSAVFDSDGYLSEFTVNAFSSTLDWSEIAYFRFCCDGIDESSIVTVNQPIA